MYKKKEKRFIDKRDKYRVLLTETLPYEVPIIFSNEEFYKLLKDNREIDESIKKILNRIIYTFFNYTIPYKYNILKDADSFRRLALLHPSSQYQFVSFYEKYSELICEYCNKTRISLRAPEKVASAFYVENEDEDKNKFVENNIEEVESELMYKHLSSYFSYRGYNKIYKFYNSKEFIELERKFQHLWNVDVASCFDSIYTHTIAWAVKNKEYVKDNVNFLNGFGPIFDSLIQKSNYNETNGIPIGPEVSRIFAEIIFQDIDSTVISELSGKDYKYGQHYSLKRYVDDYFLFANNAKTASVVLRTLKVKLKEYNFHTNERKLIKTERPFLSSKSKLIKEVQHVVADFFNELFDYGFDNEIELCKPKSIKKNKKLIKFIDLIKMSCISNEMTYTDVSSFLQGCFYSRVKKNIQILEKMDFEYLIENRSDFVKNFSLIIELMFFFYSTSPSVSSSYSFAKSLIIIKRFFSSDKFEHEHSVEQLIYDYTISFFENSMLESVEDRPFKEIQLESLNLLIVLAELDNKLLVPESFLSKMFDGRQNDYFEIIVLLFYMKD
ncbi:antiviral reverse transcriptase Drt3b, partial [Bacteriovorax sp. BSW11_IV]|uniref:antiviral reverse transcriptase Drt3b n=1 Tax=Bacteriovorax sp. BSW11_IV TaxID=1353529 RepID=UPI001E3761C8